MSLLLNCQELSKGYDGRTLFDGITFMIHDDERAGMIGPNGSGKSTLMRIMADVIEADSGKIERAKGMRVAYVAQTDEFPEDATVESALVNALSGEDISDHDREVRARILIGKMGFDGGGALVNTLSGGWRKRLAIGCAIITEPTLLLIDEPTNHLDLGGILWLERMLQNANFAFIVVTHDRYFLERVTRRIIELNPRYPDGYLSIDGPYSDFLEKREDWLAAQQKREQGLSTQVRHEVSWLRAGVQGRGTKANSRVDAAHDAIDNLHEMQRLRQQDAGMAMKFSASGRRTQNLIIAEGLAKTLGGNKLFEDVEVSLHPGTRLGLVGNNGSGKTTLLRILSGELESDGGHIKRAPLLKVASFDQNRQKLMPERSLRYHLAPTSDFVTVQGRQMHVVSFGEQFRFTKEHLDMPVKSLSGGQQARAMLAMMLLEETDVLMLDEPTNDLDIASLEVIEDGMLAYPGAIVLITHDRAMLDSICNSFVGLHDGGRSANYGSFAQWQEAEEAHKEAAKAPKQKAKGRKPRQALTAAELRELRGMENAIMTAEAEAEELQSGLSDPALLADHARMTAHCEKLHTIEVRVRELYERWEVLEAKKQG
jgi:ABC transport system ATP-binding/permease protein